MKLFNEEMINAVPAKHFARPPYRAELLNERSGRPGVVNANGINCLTFPDKPGATTTDFESAKMIAEQWNNEAMV